MVISPATTTYTGVCRACAPLGSTPVRGRMEELPGDSIPPLRFSSSMIAGLRAHDEPLAHARLGSACQQASRVRWEVTCERMATDFSRASFYTCSIQDSYRRRM